MCKLVKKEKNIFYAEQNQWIFLKILANNAFGFARLVKFAEHIVHTIYQLLSQGIIVQVDTDLWWQGYKPRELIFAWSFLGVKREN